MQNKESKKDLLLRCPFCGGKAILESDKIGKEQKLYYVSCKDDCITQYGYNPTKEYAIEKWNTRKPMQEIVERLEERTDFLKGCTKYGNKNIEQMRESYSTMMMYEVASLVDDLIDVVKEVGGMYGTRN